MTRRLFVFSGNHIPYSFFIFLTHSLQFSVKNVFPLTQSKWVQSPCNSLQDSASFLNSSSKVFPLYTPCSRKSDLFNVPQTHYSMHTWLFCQAWVAFIKMCAWLASSIVLTFCTHLILILLFSFEKYSLQVICRILRWFPRVLSPLYTLPLLSLHLGCRPDFLIWFFSCDWREALVAQSCLTLCDPMDCNEPGSTAHAVAAAAAAKSLQPCPTLCDPIDSSPPGSPVPGILQARTLE